MKRDIERDCNDCGVCASCVRRKLAHAEADITRRAAQEDDVRGVAERRVSREEEELKWFEHYMKFIESPTKDPTNPLHEKMRMFFIEEAVEFLKTAGDPERKRQLEELIARYRKP